MKYGGILLHLRILHLFNMCWKRHQVPKEWLQSKVISLFKKGSRSDPQNYRGISLLDTTYKVYARIVNNRLKTITDSLLLEEQMGFRKGRSCSDAVFAINQIIAKRREYNLETHMAFIDFTKEFDSVNRNLIWSIMELRGYPKHIIQSLQSLYVDTTIRLQITKGLTDAIGINKGV